MFIRKKIKKDLKTKREYYIYQLVESTRTEKGPRQHVLLSMSNQMMLSDTERKLLACRIEEIIKGVEPLFQYSENIENLANVFACQLLRKQSMELANEKEKVFETVELDSITHEHCRTVGLEHISWQFFRKLELDVKLKQLGFSEKQIQLIAGIIIGRLVQPGSERSTHYWLQNLTALDEVIGADFKGTTKKYDKIIERIGRLKEKYRCIAQYYKVDVYKDDKNENATNITWECNTEAIEKRFSGVYVLRCYGLEWSSSDLWQTYIMLTKVEEGFRCLKSNLGLRPIFHKTDKRVDAHLFISVLAYHIMQSILYSLEKQNINISWETLRNIMSSHTRVTTCMKNKQEQTIHIRSSTTPESHQRQIYQALNISNCPGRRIRSII